MTKVLSSKETGVVYGSMHQTVAVTPGALGVSRRSTSPYVKDNNFSVSNMSVSSVHKHSRTYQQDSDRKAKTRQGEYQAQTDAERWSPIVGEEPFEFPSNIYHSDMKAAADITHLMTELQVREEASESVAGSVESISERVCETQHNPHSTTMKMRQRIEGEIFEEGSVGRPAMQMQQDDLPPHLAMSWNEVVSKQDQLLADLQYKKERKTAQLAAMNSAVYKEFQNYRDMIRESGSAQLEMIKNQAKLVRCGEAKDEPMSGLSSFLLLPTCGESQGDTIGPQLGCMVRWPLPEEHKTLSTLTYEGSDIDHHCTLYVYKCPTPYFLEFVDPDGLFLTSDGHRRRRVGLIDVKHGHGCLNNAQTQAFFSSDESIFIYDLVHHRDISCCNVIISRQVTLLAHLEDVQELRGISHIQSANLLAVVEENSENSSIILIQCDPIAVKRIHLVEAGVLLYGGTSDITWGSTDKELYLVDTVEDRGESSMIIHLRLDPPRLCLESACSWICGESLVQQWPVVRNQQSNDRFS